MSWRMYPYLAARARYTMVLTYILHHNTSVQLFSIVAITGTPFPLHVAWQGLFARIASSITSRAALANFLYLCKGICVSVGSPSFLLSKLCTSRNGFRSAISFIDDGSCPAGLAGVIPVTRAKRTWTANVFSSDCVWG